MLRTSLRSNLPTRTFPSFLASSNFFATLSAGDFVSLLRSCESLPQLKQIHARVFRHCLHQHENALNKLVAFSADPSRGNLGYAEKVFASALEPSLFVYNVIIKAFYKKGEFRKALGAFHRLRAEGLLSPDNFTYPFVFKAVGCLGMAMEGEKILGFTVKCGLERDAYVANSAMDMYGELGRMECVEDMFEGMPKRDSVSWNVLISWYVRHGRFEGAVDAFKRMRTEGRVRPDEATIASTLSACTALKLLELGREIHHYVEKEVGYTVIIWNALLDMYAKCGCLASARKIFDEIPIRNVICWTSMIWGYVNCGRLDEARDLFDRTTVKDMILWTAMINGYVQFNQFDEAVELFQMMQRKGVRPDKFTVVALLTGCAQCGALEQGKWIHGYIDDNRMSVDAILGTALINMYAKCGCVDKALEIFSGLIEKDTASWTSMICGLAMNGKIKESLKYFAEMRKLGFRPDDITFIGVLSACSHGGFIDEGRRLFSSMTDTYGIKPKLEHYGCMVDLLGRDGSLEEAENLIKEVPDGNNEILVPLYSALLGACRLHGNVTVGERTAERLAKMEFNDSGAHTLLANIYASANRWEDMMMVRRKMKALGVKKLPGCSSIEVDGAIHEFIVADLSHPAMENICYVLERLALLFGELEGEESHPWGRELVA
ncbi:hypothetical protein MLD38_014810 [Melastoma candidum]|uniref:Uncharacterized protein n=1 Tax=Melastoma candidum TaxID=119954 RepID=A0ACB9RDK5_9MYRT|nr:hypothetical protein MLD38_014810 [Melastoma candidum]